MCRQGVSALSVVGCIATACLARGRDTDALPALVLALVVALTVRRADLAVSVRLHASLPGSVARPIISSSTMRHSLIVAPEASALDASMNV